MMVYCYWHGYDQQGDDRGCSKIPAVPVENGFEN